MIKIWRFFWKEYWNFTEIFHSLTGLRFQRPIEIFFPNHCEWVFEQMTGFKGERIKLEDSNE